MIRQTMSALWTLAVLFALVEAKQVKVFLPSAIWPYPEYGILLLIALLSLLLRLFINPNTLRFDRKYLHLCLYFTGFALVYVLCTLINALIAPRLEEGEMLGGISRVVLQFVFAPPLVLASLHAVFGERRLSALKSFLFPGLMELILLIGGDLAFAVNFPSQWTTQIGKEILSQSWVEIGSKVFFVPKWGGTFAESQELGLLILISLLLLELWMQQTQMLGSRWKILKFVYIGSIFLTASKGVLAGLFVFYLFRNRRFFQLKLTGLLLVSVIGSLYLGFSIYSHPEALQSQAFSYASLDERIFHILYFLRLCASNPIHLFIGFGARQYGALVAQAYPAVFTKSTNAVSIFSIVADSGVLGMTAYLVMIAYLMMSLKGYLPRLVFISGFIATLWMPDWSMQCYIFFLLIMFFACSQTGFPRPSEGPSSNRLHAHTTGRPCGPKIEPTC